jgi:hypothetical protein
MYRLKSLLIILLAVLAVYQTWQLWFVNFTNRSFFDYFTVLFDRGVPDGNTDIVRPTRIVVGNGDGRFDMRYGIGSPPAEEAIAEILRRGVFGGTTRAQHALEAALAQPVILFEYAFPMRADIFATAFNQRTGMVLTDRGVETFNAVAIIPTGVIFIDEKQDRAWTFNLPSGEFAVGDFYIDTGLFFISDLPHGFLPRTQTGWRYRPLLMTNPYTNRSGEVQLNSVNAQVAHFFDNPAVRNPRMEENVITISTINTVVRYLPGNILEYNCFRPIRRDNPPDFMTDFSAALAFIRRDPHAASHDFFLVGYEVQGRTHVFHFNYIIGGPESGGFPLLPPEHGWGPTHDPLHFPIEIVVDHGRVSRYRKLTFVFDLDTTQQQVLTRASLAAAGEGTAFTLGYPAVQGAGLELSRGENR